MNQRLDEFPQSHKSFMLFVRNILADLSQHGRREGNGNQQNALEYIPLFNPPEGLMSLYSQPPLWKVYWQKWIKNMIVCGQLDDESPGCKGWQEAHVLIHLYLIMINRLHEIYWLLPGGNSQTFNTNPHTFKNFSYASTLLIEYKLCLLESCLF